jgi:hypothetical protein
LQNRSYCLELVSYKWKLQLNRLTKTKKIKSPLRNEPTKYYTLNLGSCGLYSVRQDIPWFCRFISTKLLLGPILSSKSSSHVHAIFLQNWVLSSNVCMAVPGVLFPWSLPTRIVYQVFWFMHSTCSALTLNKI